MLIYELYYFQGDEFFGAEINDEIILGVHLIGHYFF